MLSMDADAGGWPTWKQSSALEKKKFLTHFNLSQSGKLAAQADTLPLVSLKLSNKFAKSELLIHATGIG